MPAVPPALPVAAPVPLRQAAKAAQDFEAMALGQLLQPMFATVDSAHGIFGGGAGEETWRPMLVNEIAKHITARGGIGLSGPVLREMLQRQEAHVAESGS